MIEKAASRSDYSNNKRAAGGHLSEEHICAYQYGFFFSPEAERRAQDHLVECRRCASLLLELDAFAESVSTNSGSPAENTDGEWARFQARRFAETPLERKNTAARPASKAAPPRRFFGFSSYGFAAAAAAALGLAAIVSTAAIYLALRSGVENAPQIARRTSPQIADEKAATIDDSEPAPNEKAANKFAVKSNDRASENRGELNSMAARSGEAKNKAENKRSESAKTVRETKKMPGARDETVRNAAEFSLYPDETVRGAADLRTIRSKQHSASPIRLKLNAPAAENNNGFTLRILDSQEKVVLAQPVVPDRRGDFSVVIAASRLPAGVCKLNVYIESRAARKLFAVYSFQVEYQ